MKLLLAILLIGSVAAQEQAKFQTKFMNLVTDYLGANTGKAMDMVGQDALAEKTIKQIVEHLMSQIMGLIPSGKYLSGMGMLNNLNSCLKSAGSSMEKAMGNIGGAFQKQLTPLYKKVMTKVKAMKKNKKEDKAILNEGFKIANAGLTKKLVQGVINVCMTKSTKKEYDCALPALNTVMKTAHYNMNYDAKRG